jgi:alkylhydroperoxidase family enzyme
VQAVLTDYEKAPIDARMRATLKFLKKLTLTPEQVTPGDADSARAAGVNDQELADAVLVCFVFSLMDRVADSFGIELPPPPALRRLAPIMLRRGYR